MSEVKRKEVAPGTLEGARSATGSATGAAMARRIDIINSSLRDGQQALWSGRLTTAEMLPIARTIDLAGYHSVDFMTGVQIDVSVRYLKENPWERARAIRRVIKHTPMICHLRSRSLTSFDLVPDAVFELMVARLAANGFRRAMVFDPLHNLDNLRFSTQLAKRYGFDVSVVLFFSISPVHTDEYYAQKSAELAGLGPDALCIRDPSGLLTEERMRSLVPLVRRGIGDLPLELKSQCIMGLAEDCYLAGASLGVDRFFAAAEPLANGPSVPSIAALLTRFQAAGFNPCVDERRAQEEADYFAGLAAETGRPTGKRVQRTDAAQHTHQIPGNMIQFTRDQLRAMKLEHKLPEVLEEFPQVRADMGYPVMVTPVSQLVCVQAVLNVVYGERYKLIPNEVRNYVRGHYGKPEAPLAPELVERVGEGPAPALDGGEQVLERIRREFGPFDSDDDLILHVLFRPDQLAGVLEPKRGRAADTGLSLAGRTLLALVQEIARRETLGNVEVRGRGFSFSGRM